MWKLADVSYWPLTNKKYGAVYKKKAFSYQINCMLTNINGSLVCALLLSPSLSNLFLHKWSLYENSSLHDFYVLQIGSHSLLQYVPIRKAILFFIKETVCVLCKTTVHEPLVIQMTHHTIHICYFLPFFKTVVVSRLLNLWNYVSAIWENHLLSGLLFMVYVFDIHRSLKSNILDFLIKIIYSE